MNTTLVAKRWWDKEGKRKDNSLGLSLFPDLAKGWIKINWL